MTGKPIIIFGSGGEAKVAAAIIQASQTYSFAGFVNEENEKAFLETHRCGVIAIGDGRLRATIAQRILKRCPAFTFPAVIHPSAVVEPTASIGSGVIIHATAYVGVDATIGDHVLINTGARIDHDTVIDNYASIAPAAATGGNVRIGQGAFVGLGARIIQSITIGQNAIVGAGTTIVRDVPDNTKIYTKSPLVTEIVE